MEHWLITNQQEIFHLTGDIRILPPSATQHIKCLLAFEPEGEINASFDLDHPVGIFEFLTRLPQKVEVKHPLELVG